MLHHRNSKKMRQFSLTPRERGCFLRNAFDTRRATFIKKKKRKKRSSPRIQLFTAPTHKEGKLKRKMQIDLPQHPQHQKGILLFIASPGPFGFVLNAFRGRCVQYFSVQRQFFRGRGPSRGQGLRSPISQFDVEDHTIAPTPSPVLCLTGIDSPSPERLCNTQIARSAVRQSVRQLAFDLANLWHVPPPAVTATKKRQKQKNLERAGAAHDHKAAAVGGWRQAARMPLLAKTADRVGQKLLQSMRRNSG
ncbi:uncharacterized protein [Drosophila bipectinata]|uniref:uncharacterized protein isoform X2 n=1 Tax=Drosophila bipectinata TaxID=42026 RepID=UPI0038B37260